MSGWRPWFTHGIVPATSGRISRDNARPAGLVAPHARKTSTLLGSGADPAQERREIPLVRGCRNGGGLVEALSRRARRRSSLSRLWQPQSDAAVSHPACPVTISAS